MDQSEKVYTEISSILSKSNISHSKEDIQQIINISNQFYDSGYEFNYNEVATFLTTEKNLEYINNASLQKVLISMKQTRLGTIIKKKKPTRNETCVCNSGKKYKNCCINK